MNNPNHMIANKLTRLELKPFEGTVVNLKGTVDTRGEHMCLKDVMFLKPMSDDRFDLGTPASGLPGLDHVWIQRHEHTLLRCEQGDTVVLIGGEIVQYHKGWTVNTNRLRVFGIIKQSQIAEFYFVGTSTSMLTCKTENGRDFDVAVVLEEIWEPELRQNLSFALARLGAKKLLRLLRRLTVTWAVNQDEILFDWAMLGKLRSDDPQYLIPLFVCTMRRICEGKLGKRWDPKSQWKVA